MNCFLLKVTGIKESRPPANGKYYQTEELQQIVGGYFEFVWLSASSLLVIDEEGRLKNLPENENASKLAGRLIVGDALVIDKEYLETEG